MQSMKKTWQNVLYICILLAAIVMLFQWYSLSNRQRIEKQNLDYAINTADQTAGRIEGEFQNALLRIRNYAYLLGTTQDEPEITAEILRQMEQNTAFNAIHYTGPDGFTLSSGGERLDSRDRFFYQNGMRGQSGIDLVRSSDNERLMIVFYAPIMQGGEAHGIMLGLYFTEDYLQNMLNVNFFGEPAESFLCTRNGEIIAGSSGSTFDIGVADLLLRTGSIDAEMAEEINACLRSENDLVGLTCAPGSLTDNLCISPIRKSEYMLLQTFPKSVTQSMLHNANHSGMVLQIILILLFAAYILILLLRARRERTQMQRESQEHISGLQEKEFLANRKERQYRIAIMSSAFSTFEFNLTRDLIENDIVRTENGEQSSLLEKVGLQAPCRASECFEKWKTFIEDESVEDYASTVNLDYLKERFQAGEADVTVDYWSHGVTGRQMCIRQSFIMTSDERSGDIMVMVVSKDITAQVRKQREQTQALRDALMQAQRANSAKTVFLSNMSHDIRTPMNAVLGFTTLLAKDAENPEKVREYTKKITASGQHLLSLINDILDVSKIESGKVVLTMEEFTLNDLVSSVDAIIRPMANNRNQTFYVQVTGIQHEYLVGDETRINQILINLLSNAVKYTPEGGDIWFRIIGLKQHSSQFEHIRIEVEDNGYGMTPEYLTTIFDAFTRAENSTTNKVQGTGLGMAITKNIVELMGGSIDVVSEVDKGSIFRVELELRISENETYKQFWKENGISRILVVSSDTEECANISLLMKESEVDAESVPNLQETLVLLRQKHSALRYQMILIDWETVKTDEIASLRELRELVSEGVPILFGVSCTGNSAEEAQHEEILGIPNTGILTKPFFVSACQEKILDMHMQQNGSNTAESAERNNLSGLHFLAAEDNDINAEILIEILSIEGAACEVVENGRMVVERFASAAKGEFDAILMDVQMPVMNGYDATRAIRALPREDAVTIPIIAMTANAFAEDEKEALEAGMNIHLAKPIDIELLKKVIYQCVQKK